MDTMKIVNVVVTGDFHCKLDLDRVVKVYKCKYNRNRFSGAIWKDHGACCLLFSTGRFVICGVKSFGQAVQVAALYGAKLAAIGYRASPGAVKLSTMTASHDFRQRIWFDRLYSYFANRCDYTPEIFPALMIRKGKAHGTLFHNGKLIITGVKSREDLNSFFTEISQALGHENCNAAQTDLLSA